MAKFIDESKNFFYVSPEKMTKIQTKSKNLIQSIYFLGLMVFLVMLVYIIRMVQLANTSESDLPGAGGIIPDSWNGHPFEYIRQTIQSLGSISICIGITLIARGKKVYGPFALFGNAMIFSNGLITGLWFETMTRAIMFSLYAIQWHNWDKRDNAGVTIGRSNKYEWCFFVGMLLLFTLGLALPFTLVEVGTHDDGTPKYISDVIGMKAAFPDAIQSSLNIVGVYLCARRRTEGQLALVISNTSALIMFIITNQPVMVMSTAVFLIISFAAWIVWEAEYSQKTENSFFYIFKRTQ